jgi:hypothetical protein
MMPIERVVPESSPLSHTALAQALITEIRATRERIPNFTVPDSLREKQSIATIASIPPQFVERAAVAISNTPSLVRHGGVEPERIRDLMSFGAAFESYADELEAMASFVRHSIAAAKQEAAREALTTYALAQRLTKIHATADLAPHVADMRDALGKRVARKTKAKPPTVPAANAPSPVTP